MLSLIKHRAGRTSAPPVSPACPQRQRAPRMRSMPRSAVPAHWTARATHYFDAAWHTSLTLRQLMQASLTGETLGLRKPPELLMTTMEAMLNSICPGLPDDAESKDWFHRLLQMHLSVLTAGELGQLKQMLKDARFDHVVVEPVIDDVMVAEHGFANGPPHCRHRTLMFTTDLHHAIDDAIQVATGSEAAFADECRLMPAQAQEARDLLASLAERHARGGVTLTALACAANQLAQATGTVMKTDMAVAAQPLPPASSVSWQAGMLIVEQRTLTRLAETRNGTLEASLLRDLLELQLAHKLFGASVELIALSAGQRALLQREVEQVLSRPPGSRDSAVQARAAMVIARRASFGTMQIFPTAGTMLGHAWISPVLSVVPDKSRKGIEAGKRFMRPGFRLEPVQSTVNEWDMRWLSARENDELYPAAHAWHLAVPAHWLKLQQAAEHTREEWQSKKVPYRFIGTEPGMPATGCRATVWHAARHAMDDDTRSLFEHFILGLPEPESPTELALRMRQFTHWLEDLAARAVGERRDL